MKSENGNGNFRSAKAALTYFSETMNINTSLKLKYSGKNIKSDWIPGVNRDSPRQTGTYKHSTFSNYDSLSALSLIQSTPHSPELGCGICRGDEVFTHMETEMSPPSKSHQKSEASYQKPSECATLRSESSSVTQAFSWRRPSQHLECDFVKGL